MKKTGRCSGMRKRIRLRQATVFLREQFACGSLTSRLSKGTKRDPGRFNSPGHREWGLEIRPEGPILEQPCNNSRRNARRLQAGRAVVFAPGAAGSIEREPQHGLRKHDGFSGGSGRSAAPGARYHHQGSLWAGNCRQVVFVPSLVTV